MGRIEADNSKCSYYLYGNIMKKNENSQLSQH
jgi:hypothetical protein